MGTSLVVLTPRYDIGEKQYYDCFAQLLVPGRVNPVTGSKIPGKTIVMRKDDTTIRAARTQLAQEALAGVPEADFFLWIDDDMVFDPYVALNLMKQANTHNLDIIGGLCFNRRHPFGPTLFRKFPEVLCRSGFGIVYTYPKDQLLQIDATGHGFLLVRPRVYEALRKADGHDDWYLPVDGELSEDLAFCMRAEKLGFKTWVDTGCKIGHVGKFVIDEAFAERNRQFEHETHWTPTEVAHGDAPAVTIVIPAYNQKTNYLKAAVLSAAYQTVPVEVIVVDDGSDPPIDPLMFAGLSNVHVFRHEKNRGIAAALNTGISKMTTEWFCWLSSDDLFDNRKVQWQLSAALQTGSKALFTMYQIEGEGQNFASVPSIPLWHTMAEQSAVLGTYCAINGSTVMVHKSVIDTVGDFDETYRYGQDWEWFCRIGRKYHWFPVQSILTTRRTEDNLTARIEKDPELTAVRGAEDARIRSIYAVM